MANKNFQNYAVAGNNVALTYDNVNDTVTFDVNVDKNDVGLGNVDNTSDINKPISTLVQNALNLKEGVITAGTTAQYYRGDKTFQTLDKTAVGLSNVDNTSDVNKPISTATQTALNGKQNLATNLTSISALTFASTSFVKMTAAGTFALDTNTYLTAETDTLASVTGRGATTTTAVTMGKLTTTGSITAASAIARGVYMNQTLVAAANNDVLVGLDINPTFTVGAFTGTTLVPLRIGGSNGGAGILFSNQNWKIGSNGGNIVYNGGQAFDFYSGISATPITFSISTSRIAQFHATTGNLTLQNGGTFTDAGFRLDVVGADSRFNGIRAGLGAGQVASNTVFGNGALGSNSTGTGVTAIGFEALKVSTGNNNTAFGYRVGVGITTGVNNTGVGHFALTNNGSNNTAVGMYAYTYGTGNSNTAIGLQSLYNTGSSNSNTAIGYQTLTSNTGNLNTAVGYQSGNANTSGANNTLLGANTVTGNFSGCLILGKDATATANNQFVVGSSTVNAGAVITATSPTINEYWTVIINGVSKKIALIS